MKMLEKVARAICDVTEEWDDGGPALMTLENQDTRIKEARAAIEALMEPTLVMRDAAAMIKPYDQPQTPEAVWRAMLNAALEESQA